MFLVKHCSLIRGLMFYGEGGQSLACAVSSPFLSFDWWLAEIHWKRIGYGRRGRFRNSHLNRARKGMYDSEKESQHFPHSANNFSDS